MHASETSSFTLEDDKQKAAQEVQPMRCVPTFGQIQPEEGKGEDWYSLSYSGMRLQDVQEQNLL